MQTTYKEKNWFVTSRFNGIMKYYGNQLGKTVLYVMIVLLVFSLLSFAMAFLPGNRMYIEGVGSEFAITLCVALVAACSAANKGTRFVLRFGTSRFSTWLANVLSLIVWMAILLIATLLLNAITTAGMLALERAMPQHFINYMAMGNSGAGMYGSSLASAFGDLPRQLLWVAEWSCIFYLFGCCLRRNKKLTIAVLIGIPLLAIFSTFIPAVQQTLYEIGSMSEGEIMVEGLRIYRWISDAAIWIGKHWKWIQLGAAGISLPLSYLCMRGTSQP